MTTVSTSFTSVTVSASLRLQAAGEDVAYSLSGTYAGVFQLERATSPDEKAWEIIAGPFSTANASVSGVYTTTGQNESLRWRATTHTSGTAVTSMADGDKIQRTQRDEFGNIRSVWRQSGVEWAGESIHDGTDYRRATTNFLAQGTPAAKTTSATLTAAEVLGGIITVNQGGAGVSTLTMPLGDDLEAALPANIAVGDSFEFSIINISTVAAEDAVLAVNTGVTAVGNLDVASNAAATDKSAGRFRVRRTAASTFVVYRVG